MKNYFLFICMSIIIGACQQEDAIRKNSVISEVDAKADCLTLKKNFSSALVKVLATNEEVRNLIKNEAIKQFDFDYDVLYQLIKNEKLENGKSLEELLSQYLSTDELERINKELPTLTMLVPSLPEDSFSAEQWDVINEKPAVAVKISDPCDVLVYYPSGEQEIIPSGIIPGFPIIAVKESDRIIPNTALTRSIDGNVITNQTNGSSFKFINNIFDNSSDNLIKTANNHELITKGSRPSPPSEQPYPYEKYKDYLNDNVKKIMEAYDIYPNNTGWQRDYIYYNISPNQEKGALNYNYKEHIVGFKLLGDGLGVYQKISDQDDPVANLDKIYSTRDYLLNWTDGEFEFEVLTYVGCKNAVGNEIRTMFRAKPSDLFKAKYKKVSERPGNVQYKVENLDLLYLPLSLPLFEWNLEEYSSTIKIAIGEVDGTETQSSTYTTSSEFAANFGFDVSFGQTVKKGAKFGTSIKETRTTSFVKTKSLGSDELGEVIINFADPIIINKDLNVHWKLGPGPRPTQSPEYSYPAGYNPKYFTGWYQLYIAPLKTY